MANWGIVVLGALVLLLGLFGPDLAEDSMSDRALVCVEETFPSREEERACGQIPEAEFGFPLAGFLYINGEIFLEPGIVIMIGGIGLVLRHRRMMRVLRG